MIRALPRAQAAILSAAILAMVMELLGAGRVARGEPRPATAPKPHQCQPANFRVVVDVGHTVDVPGAISAHGVTEYDYNLKLGQDTAKALTDAGFVNASLLVTNVAPWAGLVQRANYANAQHADLFISIHHDSVPDALLKEWQFNGQDLHYNDDFPGYAIFISNDNGDRGGSLMFGRMLGQELEARGEKYTPHYTLPLMGSRRRLLVDAKAGVYTYDQLIVLRMTRMPAVLLEAGSIINRQEELELATAERRAMTSSAIVAAVKDFCDARANAPATRTVAAPGAVRARPPEPPR
jgi:N-acetylmuramoyl-L-alanine amidase